MVCCLPSEIIEHGKEYDNQCQGGDNGQQLLTGHVALLLRYLGFLLLRIVEGSQFHGFVLLPLDDSRVDAIANEQAQGECRVTSLRFDIDPILGQQIALDIIEGVHEVVFVHLIVQNLKIACSLLRALCQHQIVDGF